jgi:hypothetical protein
MAGTDLDAYQHLDAWGSVKLLTDNRAISVARNDPAVLLPTRVGVAQATQN